jgi:predicted nucleotidyltransferase
MLEVTAQVLDEIVWAIVDAVHPEQIILFGSRARDASSPESDLDLLVVESEPFHAGRSRRKEMARVWSALPRLLVPTDVLVYSREEVDRWRHSPNHILSRALREGRFLYARP